MTYKKLPTPHKTLKNARQLRTLSTNAERLLWSKIRNRQCMGLKFRRQHPILPYIVDFFCEDILLIIELDGGQHNENIDMIRTKFLHEKGYKILRYWNNDVLKNMEGVFENIVSEIKNIGIPSPPPSPGGRGKKDNKENN